MKSEHSWVLVGSQYLVLAVILPDVVFIYRYFVCKFKFLVLVKVLG